MSVADRTGKSAEIPGLFNALHTSWKADRLSPRRNTLRKSCQQSQVTDSGAANSSNLCTATKPPEGCHAIVRSVARLAQQYPRLRRAEGKLYKLQHVLLFSILAVVTGGNSYRSIVTFIKVHRRRLNAAFGLHWRRAPAHTSIRYILQGLDPQAVEQIFRQHAAGLCGAITDPARRVIAIDGKTLRRSFDNFTDRKAAQVLHAFDVEAGLVSTRRYRGRVQRNPAAQQLLGELHVAHSIVTLDAMHCTKKTFEAAAQAASSPHRPTEGQSALAAAGKSKPPALPSGPSAATPRSALGATDTKLQVGPRSSARPAPLPATEWNSLIKSIVRVTREVLHRDAKTGL